MMRRAMQLKLRIATVDNYNSLIALQRIEFQICHNGSCPDLRFSSSSPTSSHLLDGGNYEYLINQTLCLRSLIRVNINTTGCD